MHLLSQRRRQPEVMDQPDLAPARHAHALAGLARINFISRSSAILFPSLVALQRRLAAPQLRILDVASGGGDVPIRLWQRARRAGLDWSISGCDVSPVAVEHARARAAASRTPIDFFVYDVLARPLPGSYDAVTSSLFLHHLDEGPAVALLRSMAGGEDGPALILVNDLERSLRGFLLAHLATRLLTTSAVVHIDGPLSVQAAFTREEAVDLAEHAGLSGATVRRRWPCRWLLSWSRPS